MRVLSIVLGCLFVIGITGCGGGPDNNVVIQIDYDPLKELKDGLEGVSKSGRIGSNFNNLMNASRTLKTKDASKGEAVEKALTELRNLKEPPKIKAKAEEIIKSL
jgi:hypothetical protein